MLYKREEVMAYRRRLRTGCVGIFAASVLAMMVSCGAAVSVHSGDPNAPEPTPSLSETELEYIEVDDLHTYEMRHGMKYLNVSTKEFGRYKMTICIMGVYAPPCVDHFLDHSAKKFTVTPLNLTYAAYRYDLTRLDQVGNRLTTDYKLGKRCDKACMGQWRIPQYGPDLDLQLVEKNPDDIGVRVPLTTHDICPYNGSQFNSHLTIEYYGQDRAGQIYLDIQKTPTDSFTIRGFRFWSDVGIAVYVECKYAPYPNPDDFERINIVRVGVINTGEPGQSGLPQPYDESVEYLQVVLDPNNRDYNFSFTPLPEYSKHDVDYTVTLCNGYIRPENRTCVMLYRLLPTYPLTTGNFSLPDVYGELKGNEGMVVILQPYRMSELTGKRTTKAGPDMECFLPTKFTRTEYECTGECRKEMEARLEPTGNVLVTFSVTTGRIVGLIDKPFHVYVHVRPREDGLVDLIVPIGDHLCHNKYGYVFAREAGSAATINYVDDIGFNGRVEVTIVNSTVSFFELKGYQRGTTVVFRGKLDCFGLHRPSDKVHVKREVMFMGIAKT